MPEIRKIGSQFVGNRLVAKGTFLRERRDADDITSFFDVAGKVFFEYYEVWERDRGDEECKTKRRMSQRPTGRRFKALDVIPGERFYDRSIPYVTRPCDFTYIRLRELV